MHFSLIGNIKKNKLLSKLLAVLSVFAISTTPVEARTPVKGKSAVTRIRAKKRVVQTRSIRKAPVRRARKAAAPRRQKLSPRQIAAQMRQKQAAARKAAVLRQRQAAARKAVVLRQRQAAARKAAVLRQRQAAARKAVVLRQQQASAAQKALFLRQQQAAAAAQQAEILRLQREVAAREAEVMRLEDLAHPLQVKAALPNFLTQAFNQAGLGGFTRQVLNAGGGVIRHEALPMADLGYGVGPLSGRTRQYGGQHLPKALTFHTYDIINPDIQDRFGAPAYTLNVKLPGYHRDFVPAALAANLAGIRPKNIDMFLQFQDMPWLDTYRNDEYPVGHPNHAAGYKAGDPAPILLRPQYWLDPDAPNAQANYNKHFPVAAGVFPSRPGGPTIQGQAANGLVYEPNISVHTGPGNLIVSSGPTLPIANLGNLERNNSHLLYSLARYGNKAAVGIHVLWNHADETRFEKDLANSIGPASVAAHTDNLTGLKARLKHKYPKYSASGRAVLDELEDIIK